MSTETATAVAADLANHLQIDLRCELLARGWNDRAIGRMLSSGGWHRVRHGAYCDASAWSSLDAAGRHLVRTRAVLRQARTPLVVSHSSALPIYGAPTWRVPLVDVDVTRRDGRIGRHEAGVHQHRGVLLEDDVVSVGGLDVVTATRAALEITTQVPVETALVVVNHLLHAGLTTPEALDARYRRAAKPIYLWPRSLNSDLVLRLASPLPESVGESRFAYLCFAESLPAPVLQHEVLGPEGRLVARLDFAWPQFGVFAEFDGKVKYEQLLKPGQRASDVVVAEKRREDLITRLTGWRCVRVVWSDLEHPARTAAMLRPYFARPTAA